jgi:heme-degrading monooxygenase HmoA
MYTRGVWIQSSPDGLDERIANFPSVSQRIKDAPGCTGVALLVDRGTGAGIAVSYWDTAESMHANEPVAEAVRAQAAQTDGWRVVDVDHFEFLVQERALPPAPRAFVRVNDLVAPPANVDEIAKLLKDRAVVARSRAGFRALLVSANRLTGRMLVATIWTTAAEREASAATAQGVRDEMRKVTNDASVKVELYEAAYTDIKISAPV